MRYIWKIVFSVFLIILGWILANLHNTMKQEKVIPDVVTVEVKKGRLQEKVNVLAKISEKEIINITSSVAFGIVGKIYVKEGDYVKDGQVLVELREAELINELKKEEFKLDCEIRKQTTLQDFLQHPQVIEKKEDIKRIQWDIKEMEKILNDSNELYAKGAIAYREIEKQELEKKRLEMNLKSRLSEQDELFKRLEEQKREVEVTIPAITYRINELKYQIKGCQIVSPVRGLVKKLKVDKNQKVEYGSSLLNIATTDELVGKGFLKESNFFLVKPGQKVVLVREELNKKYQGKVLTVLPVASIEKDISDKEVDFEIVCSIENPEGLVAGMKLPCEIIIEENNVESIIIPPEVLYEEDAVLVVENGIIKKKKIAIGKGTLDQIEVIEGLMVGEKVIVRYSEEIREGMKVKEGDNKQ